MFISDYFKRSRILTRGYRLWRRRLGLHTFCLSIAIPADSQRVKVLANGQDLSRGPHELKFVSLSVHKTFEVSSFLDQIINCDHLLNVIYQEQCLMLARLFMFENVKNVKKKLWSLDLDGARLNSLDQQTLHQLIPLSTQKSVH